MKTLEKIINYASIKLEKFIDAGSIILFGGKSLGMRGDNYGI